ncbi:MAG TPA: Uma2 family endonuclease [Gemmataceae bacterium]|nr:Uma2 family endonuclease [Gemmataceae bacterium]
MAALLFEEIRGLDRLPPDALYEVIDGEAKEIPPTGFASTVFASEFAVRLGKARPSARDVIAVESLFALPAPVDRRRRPDLAYLPAARVPANWPPPLGEDPPHIDAVPALAVEVVSPSDLAVELEEKCREYLRAGVVIVLAVYPSARTIHVYEAGSSAQVLTEADTLNLGSVIAGFSVPVADLFAPLNPPVQP